MTAREIRFCPYCGHPTIHKHFAGKERPVCPSCDWVYFPDPKVAVAVVIVEDNKILLVRRSYNPHAGKWALPAGFVDAFENPQQAAIRECLEETGLQVQIVGLLAVLSGREHPRGADIMIAYCAEITGGKLSAGDDADEAAFFGLDELPELAFSTTEKAVNAWVSKFPCVRENTK
jgi:8-oxo-dGTP diphosphatase